MRRQRRRSPHPRNQTGKREGDQTQDREKEKEQNLPSEREGNAQTRRGHVQNFFKSVKKRSSPKRARLSGATPDEDGNNKTEPISGGNMLWHKSIDTTDENTQTSVRDGPSSRSTNTTTSFGLASSTGPVYVSPLIKVRGVVLITQDYRLFAAASHVPVNSMKTWLYGHMYSQRGR